MLGNRDGKAYKIAHAKLWVWKISTQNMCKKYPKSCKICKIAQNCPKLHKKRQNNCNKTREKKLEQLWKISTRGACAACIFFHICLYCIHDVSKCDTIWLYIKVAFVQYNMFTLLTLHFISFISFMKTTVTTARSDVSRSN